jgi:hypothetical protein
MGDYHEGIAGSPAGLGARRQYCNYNDRSLNRGGADRIRVLRHNFLNCAQTLDAVSTLGPQFLALHFPHTRCRPPRAGRGGRLRGARMNKFRRLDRSAIFFVARRGGGGRQRDELPSVTKEAMNHEHDASA